MTTRAERRERWGGLVTTDYFETGADGVRWMAIDDEQSHQAIAITLVEHAWTHSEPDGGDGGLNQRCVLRAIDQVKARAILTPAVRTWLTNMPHKSGCLLSDRGITLYTRGHCSPRELGDLAQRVRELVRMIASGGATN